MSNPKVYVGTYRAYNNGSLRGGWISLKACKDYADFLRKCRALHRGERDPEYMIQDTEDFPDGLDCGEWLSEQDFNDVIAACREEEEDATAPLSMAEKLRQALLARMGKKAANADTCSEKAMLEEYMAEMKKVWTDKRMLDYERKQFSGAVRLQNGGMVYFTKPSIENRFCFHDEGPQYDYYCELMADKDTRLRDHFLHANLDSMDEMIRALECNCHFPDNEYHSSYYCKTWYLNRESYAGETEQLNLYDFHALREYDVNNEPWRYKPGTYEKMTEADRLTILAGMRRERDKFEKRLQTYLKRYGTSKIHTWTYWADA